MGSLKLVRQGKHNKMALGDCEVLPNNSMTTAALLLSFCVESVTLYTGTRSLGDFTIANELPFTYVQKFECA